MKEYKIACIVRVIMCWLEHTKWWSCRMHSGDIVTDVVVVSAVLNPTGRYVRWEKHTA